MIAACDHGAGGVVFEVRSGFGSWGTWNPRLPYHRKKPWSSPLTLLRQRLSAHTLPNLLLVCPSLVLRIGAGRSWLCFCTSPCPVTFCTRQIIGSCSEAMFWVFIKLFMRSLSGSWFFSFITFGDSCLVGNLLTSFAVVVFPLSLTWFETLFTWPSILILGQMWILNVILIKVSLFKVIPFCCINFRFWAQYFPVL
jgi:hypothetical protein